MGWAASGPFGDASAGPGEVYFAHGYSCLRQGLRGGALTGRRPFGLAEAAPRGLYYFASQITLTLRSGDSRVSKGIISASPEFTSFETGKSPPQDEGMRWVASGPFGDASAAPGEVYFAHGCSSASPRASAGAP